MSSTSKVLAWVNRQRANKLGLKPITRLRPGHRSNPESCVIAQSLIARTKRHAATMQTSSAIGEDVLIKHPKYVVDFIKRFDKGKYPELER